MPVDKTNTNLAKFDTFIQQNGPVETGLSGSRKFIFEGKEKSLNQIIKEFKRCLTKDPNFDPVQADRIMKKFEEWKNVSNYSSKLGPLGKGIAKIGHKVRQMGNLFYRRDSEIQKLKRTIDNELHRPAFDKFKKDFAKLREQYPNAASTPEATYIGMKTDQQDLQIPANFNHEGTLLTFIDQKKTLWVAIYDSDPRLSQEYSAFRVIKSYANVDDATIEKLEQTRLNPPMLDVNLD